MKVREVLEMLDEIKQNEITDRVKTNWINNVEGRVQCEMLGKTPENFKPVMGEDEDLTVPDAYSSIYILYLSAMIELCAGNIDRYGKYYDRFEKEMGVFAKKLIRER